MYAQPPALCSYQPSGFSVYSQPGPWEMNTPSNVHSAMTEDECFIRQFERNVLATKTQPTKRVNTVKVRGREIFAFLTKA